ncbi:MAG TPA: pinensin family lanthipeptide, partial [Longimicrobium sp.]
MKKLSLRIDELEIESFETHLEPENRGTVVGQQETPYAWICTAEVSCDYGCDTINYSCPTAVNCQTQTCPSDTCPLPCRETYYAWTCPP